MVYDGHLLCIGFPKLIANFGLLGQEYFKHNVLHIFLCFIIDIIPWMLTILFSTFHSICPCCKKNATNSAVSSLVLVYASLLMPVNGGCHPHSHFCQALSECVSDTVLMCVSTGHQTWYQTSDILPSHMIESESRLGPFVLGRGVGWWEKLFYLWIFQWKDAHCWAVIFFLLRLLGFPSFHSFFPPPHTQRTRIEYYYWHQCNVCFWTVVELLLVQVYIVFEILMT